MCVLCKIMLVCFFMLLIHDALATYMWHSYEQKYKKSQKNKYSLLRRNELVQEVIDEHRKAEIIKTATKYSQRMEKKENV